MAEITIVIPEIFVWFLSGLIILEGFKKICKIIQFVQQRKIDKLRREQKCAKPL